MKSLQIRHSAMSRNLLFLIGGLLLISYKTTAVDYSNLKITEIHYHPMDVINGADTTEGKDLEFIEFKNIGDTAIELTGLVLDSAISYTFSNNVSLGPNKFWVIASKPSKFLAFYGMESSGNFSGNLSNSGEEILLTDAEDNEVIHFTYDDNSPWPEEPDGDGYSLVSKEYNPNTGNPADYNYWRASLNINGSPFSDDVVSGVNVIEGLNSSVYIYPNPAQDNIIVKIDNETAANNILVKIYSISGSLIIQQHIINNENINLVQEGIQSGMYIIRIETDKFIETKRLILSK